MSIHVRNVTIALSILTSFLLLFTACKPEDAGVRTSDQTDGEIHERGEAEKITALLPVAGDLLDTLLQLQEAAAACMEEKNWISWADYRYGIADLCFDSVLLSPRQLTEQLEADLRLLAASADCKQDTACTRASLKLKNYLAWLYSEKLREYERARAHYEDMQYIHENSQQKIKNPGVYLYKPLGSIYTRLGDDDKALATFRKGIACLRDSTQGSHRARLAEIYGEIAIVFLGQSRCEEAEATCRQGLSVHDNFMRFNRRLTPGEEQKLNDARGFLLLKLAESFVGQGAWADALQLAEQGRGMALNPGYQLGWKLLDAELCSHRGDYAAAVKLYRESLKLAEDKVRYPPKSREIAKIELALGRALEQTDVPDEALAFYQSALCRVLHPCDAEAIDFMPEPATFYPENVIMEALTAKGMLLYNLYPERGDSLLQLAHASLRLAIEQESRLLGAYSYESSKLKLLEDSHQRHEKMVAVCYELFELTRLPYYRDQVFHYMEKSRAVVLSEALLVESLLQQLADSQTLLQERRLVRQLQKYAEESFALRADSLQIDSQKLKDIESEVASVKLVHDRLLASLRKKSGGLFGEMHMAAVADIADVQQHLKNRGMELITYFFNNSNQELYILRLTPDNVLVHRQCLPPDFHRQLEDFQQQVYDWQSVENSDGDLAAFRRFAERASSLYNLLILPVSQRKLPQRLAIIPDGPLSNFPFDLLLTDSRTHKEVDYARLPYLVRESALHQAFSATLLLQSATRSSRFRPAYLGIAPDYTHSQLGRVDRSAEVVSTLAARMPDSKFLTDKKADKGNFMDQAGGYRILHFYGHAQANIKDPASSWLAFTPPNTGGPQASDSRTEENAGLLSGEAPVPAGALQLFELYGQKIPAELVVLSACETGRGKYAPGEGVISLARAFRYAGCPSTLMTLWKIKDEYGSVAAINLAFFSYLQQGHSKDVALQRAKLDYLEHTANPAHPAYWSAFVLIGDEQPMRFGFPLVGWLLPVAAVLALLAGIRTSRRRKRLAD